MMADEYGFDILNDLDGSSSEEERREARRVPDILKTQQSAGSSAPTAPPAAPVAAAPVEVKRPTPVPAVVPDPVASSTSSPSSPPAIDDSDDLDFDYDSLAPSATLAVDDGGAGASPSAADDDDDFISTFENLDIGDGAAPAEPKRPKVPDLESLDMRLQDSDDVDALLGVKPPAVVDSKPVAVTRPTRTAKVAKTESPRAAARPAVSQPERPAANHVDRTPAAPERKPERAETARRAGGTPQSSKMFPLGEQVDLSLIRKIIAIIDDYRSLTDYQAAIRGFIEAYVETINAKVDVNDEAALVKAIIEIDPAMRTGVHDLIEAKNRKGAERAFFLVALSESRLRYIGLMLQLSGADIDLNKISGSGFDDLRRSAEVVEKAVEGYADKNMAYITNIDKILQDAKKTMEAR
jgi:hypothetical protein